MVTYSESTSSIVMYFCNWLLRDLILRQQQPVTITQMRIIRLTTAEGTTVVTGTITVCNFVTRASKRIYRGEEISVLAYATKHVLPILNFGEIV